LFPSPGKRDDAGRLTRLNEHGQQVPILAQRTAVGGEEIEVSPEDAAHMLAHGFILDPDAPPPPPAPSPVAAAADGTKDGTATLSLHDQMPGGFGLQRQGSSDAW
jgi:hypothetical protein